MKTIRSEYLGELRTQAIHIQSGSVLTTDAPVDNEGKGEFFSPTDLVSAALGSCMLTIMGIFARRHAIDLEGTRVEITKIMASNPRRIGEICVEITFPAKEYSEKNRKLMEAAARECPVAQSLGADLIQTIIFNYQ